MTDAKCNALESGHKSHIAPADKLLDDEEEEEPKLEAMVLVHNL